MSATLSAPLWWAVIGRMHTHAFAEGVAQRNGPPVFLEKIAKGFVGEILQTFAGVE